MFGLFSRKTDFLPIWKGTPEIHCHVLPGIDDGSKNAETSHKLLEKYKQLGCHKIVATPHTMSGIYDNTPETIRTAYTSIEVPQGISLSYASEYMIDENFDRLVEEDTLLVLKDSFILVEMSFFQPPENLKEVLYKVCSKGFTPVIAHPERYAYYHQSLSVFEEFTRMGCMLQLNALSLSSHYGEAVQKVAFEMLRNNTYDFIGLDTHRIGHLNKIEVMKIPKKLELQLKTICDNTKKMFL